MPMRPQTNQNHKYLLMNGLFELLLLEELQYQEHELPAERRHPATPPPPLPQQNPRSPTPAQNNRPTTGQFHNQPTRTTTGEKQGH